MSVLFTDTMTVYNYHRDSQTDEERWLKSIVHGVQWSHNRAEVSTDSETQREKRAESITIDFRHAYGNKPYLPPHEFSKLPAEEAFGFWTLNAKSNQDVLVLGECDEEIGRGYRLSELVKDYQYAVTVTAVSDNRNRPRLKHIKVVAK